MAGLATFAKFYFVIHLQAQSLSSLPTTEVARDPHHLIMADFLITIHIYTPHLIPPNTLSLPTPMYGRVEFA